MALAGTHFERESIIGGGYRHTQHLKPIGYIRNGALQRIVPQFQDSGNPARPHLVSQAPFTVSFSNEALARYHPDPSRPDAYFEIGQPVYRQAGNVRTFDFGNPERRGNLLLWKKQHAWLGIKHGGHFVKLALEFRTNAYQGIDDRELAFPLTYAGITRQGRNLLVGEQPIMRMRPFVAYDADAAGDRVSVPHTFRTLGGQEYVVVTLPAELDAMQRPVLDPTLELQPDETDGIDTTFKEHFPTTNYDTAIYLIIGNVTDGSTLARTFIKFDLSSIPANAIITSATLSLWCWFDESSNARTFRVYRQKRAWVENQLTFNVYSTGNSWQTAGGFGSDDCEQTDIGSRDFTATETLNEFKDFSLTPTTKAGLDLGNGWMIKADTESSDAYHFRSSRYGTASQRPKLVVEYTLPTGRKFVSAPLATIHR